MCAVIGLAFIIGLLSTFLILNKASAESKLSWFGNDDSAADFSNGKSNIVLIILDDAGWADFSYQCSDPYYALSTPYMDSILRDGLSFSNYYSGYMCTPSRGSILTGRWNWVTGLQGSQLLSTCDDGHMSYDHPT